MAQKSLITQSPNPQIPITQSPNNPYIEAIDKGYLKGLESETPWEKDFFYQQYLKSYHEGEYKLEANLFGLRRMYWSGGVVFDLSGGSAGLGSSPLTIVTQKELENNPNLLPASSLKDESTILVTLEDTAVTGKYGKVSEVIVLGKPEEKEENKEEAPSPMGLSAEPQSQPEAGASLKETKTASSEVEKEDTQAIFPTDELTNNPNSKPKSSSPLKEIKDIETEIANLRKIIEEIGEYFKKYKETNEEKWLKKAVESIFKSSIANHAYKRKELKEEILSLKKEIEEEMSRQILVLPTPDDRGEDSIEKAQNRIEALQAEYDSLVSARQAAPRELKSQKQAQERLLIIGLSVIIASSIAGITTGFIFLTPLFTYLSYIPITLGIAISVLGWRIKNKAILSLEREIKDIEHNLQTNNELQRKTQGELNQSKEAIEKAKVELSRFNQKITDFMYNLTADSKADKVDRLFEQYKQSTGIKYSIDEVSIKERIDLSIRELKIKRALSSLEELSNKYEALEKEIENRLHLGLWPMALEYQQSVGRVIQSIEGVINKYKEDNILKKASEMLKMSALLESLEGIQTGLLRPKDVGSNLNNALSQLRDSAPEYIDSLSEEDKEVEALWEWIRVNHYHYFGEIFRTAELTRAYLRNIWPESESIRELEIALKTADKDLRLFFNKLGVAIADITFVEDKVTKVELDRGSISLEPKESPFIAYQLRKSERLRRMLFKMPPQGGVVVDVLQWGWERITKDGQVADRGTSHVYTTDRWRLQQLIQGSNDELDRIVSSPLVEQDISTSIILTDNQEKITTAASPALSEVEGSAVQETSITDGDIDGSANSPLMPDAEGKGGIDLSQIELTLKDQTYVSSLNPADLKVLRAAKALKDEWESLSLLYIHEIMLMLKDNLIKEIQNRDLLFGILNQLKTKDFLDPQAIQFLNFLHSQKPLSEIKLALVN